MYAVSLKAASKTSEQKVPLVGYAEVDNTNNNPQLHYYDEINDKSSKTNAEVCILVYVRIAKCTDRMYMYSNSTSDANTHKYGNHIEKQLAMLRHALLL